MKHLSERRKLLDGLLDKMEKVLQENILVIADIQRQKYNTERGLSEGADSVR